MKERKIFRTCAYCRVSSNTDIQDGSFETQCEYYEKLIKNNPEMEFVDIYGDHGKSGREMKNRPELNRMVKDCEDGKIDVVLTKSISRFARNMQECVATVRHLKDLGVAVRFEKESIDTLTMNGELILGILAAIAQEESKAISQNLCWSRKKHLERGEPWEKARYGYISVGKEHRWEVLEYQARIVQKAFYMAGMCHTYKEIADEMTRMEKETGKGRVWHKASVVNLLRSEVYIGNYLSNKQCSIIDRHGNTKRCRNKGYVDQILIEEHHPPLVSKNLYDIVQELLNNSSLGERRVKFSYTELKIMKKAKVIAAKEAELKGAMNEK